MNIKNRLNLDVLGHNITFLCNAISRHNIKITRKTATYGKVAVISRQ